MEIKSTAMTVDLDWTFAWVHSDNSRRPDLAFCVWLLLALKDILLLFLPLDIHFGIESLPLQATLPVALLFQQRSLSRPIRFNLLSSRNSTKT